MHIRRYALVSVLDLVFHTAWINPQIRTHCPISMKLMLISLYDVNRDTPEGAIAMSVWNRHQNSHVTALISIPIGRIGGA